MKNSASYRGDPTNFLYYWSVFKVLVEDGSLNMSLDEFQLLNEVIENEGIKPRHHTESYRQAYYPAYRVVLRDLFVEEFCLGE